MPRLTELLAFTVERDGDVVVMVETWRNELGEVEVMTRAHSGAGPWSYRIDLTSMAARITGAFGRPDLPPGWPSEPTDG